MKLHIITLGCKVNQYESQAIIESWLSFNWEYTNEPLEANCIIVNSCAVTEKTMVDLRNILRKVTRNSPSSKIILTGCAADLLKDQKDLLVNVLVCIPQGIKEILTNKELIEAVGTSLSLENDLAKVSLEELIANSCLVLGKAKKFPSFKISGYQRARAVLKVQDGCSHHCAYCIIPKARGGSKSRPLGDILNEAHKLLDSGFREITLSGVNLRQYIDKSSSNADFWDVMIALEKKFSSKWQGRVRFRISSLEPGQLTPKAMDFLAYSKMTAPHLHLSLQSASPDVLKNMGRSHYKIEQAVDFLKDLKSIWPTFALGADFITGFPGESDIDHSYTLEICRSLPFSYAHIFPYAKRPNTKAAAMENQIPQNIKKDRAKALRAVIEQKKEIFLQANLKLKHFYVAIENVEKNLNNKIENNIASNKLRTEIGKEEELTLENKMPQGINDYYVTCYIKNPPLPTTELVKVKPLKISKNGLIVEYIG